MKIENSIAVKDSSNSIKQPEWFESWFDTEYYQTLYQYRDQREARQLLERLKDVLRLAPHHHLLDLACGRGRHSRYLASLGLNVCGLDLSPSSIAYARAAASGAVQFEVHDMREPFGEATYDFVFNLFTSFGYFDDKKDNQQVVHNISRALKRGGKLVMEYFNPTHTLRNLKPFEVKEEGGIRFTIMKEVRNKCIYKYIKFTHDGRQHNFYERVQLLYPDDFATFFNQSGLHLSQILGDYKLNTFSDSSERMILIAEKREEGIMK